MRPVKKVALIHDICSIGKASLTNMMPILGKMGVESVPFRLCFCQPTPEDMAILQSTESRGNT